MGAHSWLKSILENVFYHSHFFNESNIACTLQVKEYETDP